MFRRFGLKPKCLNLSIFRQRYDQSTKKSRPFRRLILFTSGSTAIAGSAIFAGYYYSPEMRKIIDSFIKSQVTSEPEIEKPKIAEEMVEVKLGGSEPQQEKVENEPESVHLSSAEVMSALSDLTLRANKSLKHAFERFDDYYAYLVEFCYGKGDLANNKAIPGHAEIIECRNECRLILDELNRLLSTGYHKGCVSKLKEFVENRLASLEDLYDPRKLVDRFQLLLKEAELEYVEMDESPITQILLVRANRRLKALNQELSNQRAFKELVIEKEIQKRIRFMLDAERLILSEQISEELARESQILLDEQLDEQAARLSDQYASLMDEEQKRLSELYEHRIEEMREVEKLELRRELCVLSAKVDALENVLTRRIDLERRQQLVQGFWLNCKFA